MCGLAGFFHSDCSDQSGVLNAMLDTINHRGPDARNAIFNGPVGLGHVRLSIIDIDNGAQPMPSEDGRYTIIFNGEIYNYLELRQMLVARGCRMKTYSDTEVLLQLYIQFGEKMLDQLNGMFAFVIHDKQDNSLFIARDHFGIKPLYYYENNGTFVFGSEIKALLKHPAVPKSANTESVYDYLTFQMVLDDNTLFSGIKKLPPATFLKIQNGKIQRKEQYWRIEYNVDESKSMEQYSDELLVLLENSLSIQVRSDVPVGAYLSGGLDSSIVATLASKSYYGSFKTFTGSYREGKVYDESNYARLVSDSIGSEHHEIYPTSNDFLDHFEKLVYHMDEPTGGPGLFSQYMVSKLASEHVKVVLGGQGGDEVFGGYTRYVVAYLEQCLRGAIYDTQEEGNHVVTLNSIIPNMAQLKQYAPMIRSSFSRGVFDGMDRGYYKLVDRSPNLNALYSNDFLQGRNEELIFNKFSEIFNEPETLSYFNKMTHYDMKTLLPALLQVEDRVSMAVSVESRVPLLDKRIIELSAQMPPTMKFAGGKTKYMLLDSVRNILPKEIIDRKDKMGFPTPFNQWLAGPIKEYALDIFTSKAAAERGLYDVANIEKQIMSGSKFGRDLWGALNIEVWHRKFMD